MDVISFFSGAGGLDLGLHESGHRIIKSYDNDKFCVETLKKNNISGEIFLKDIFDIKPSELEKDTNNNLIVCGGPPCQSFSYAGKRLGLEDTRGLCFIKFLEICKEISPKYIIIENVQGLLNAKINNEKGAVLKHILEILDEIGYNVNYNLYDVADFGVPQHRKRIIFLCCKKEFGCFDSLKETHNEFGTDGKKKWITFREITNNIENHHYLEIPKSRKKFYELLKEGQCWRNLPLEMQKEAMGKSFYSSGGKTSFFRRLSYDKPSPTLVTSPIMKSTELCHPSEIRALSIEEYKRIQTFPDNYYISGNLSQQYKQIGNAVPPLFGKVIGKHIIDFENLI